MEDRRVLVIDGCSYQGTTNQRSLRNALFSLSKKKFIKPSRRLGDRVSGWYEYHLLTGRYVRFSYDFWNKRYPAAELLVEIVKVGLEIEVEKSMKITGDSRSEIRDKLEGINILVDFLNIVPGYHEVPGIKGAAQKVYEKEEVERLMKWIETFDGKEIYAQQEEVE